MDIFIDRDGNVLVRDCGCGEVGVRTGMRHGPISHWSDHSTAWRNANRVAAGAIIEGEADRLGRDHGTVWRDTAARIRRGGSA